MKIRLSLWILTAAVAFTALGCAFPKAHNLPPAQRLLEPGPGVGGPGPGVLMAEPPASGMVAAGAMMGGGGCLPGGAMGMGGGGSVQILFSRPESMQVRWDVTGTPRFDSDPLVVPGRKNFPEGGV